MFSHHFKYSFRILFRNKMLVFWTFLFPILLGTFFHMAFQDIEKNEQLDVFDIAIVKNSSYEKKQSLKEALTVLGDENSDSRLFSITYYDKKEKAEQALEDRKIEGFLYVDDTVHVIVKESGIYSTILKYTIDEILQLDNVVENIAINEMSKNPVQDMNHFYSELYQKVTKLKEQSNIKDISSHNLSYTMIEFYTLIAMACLYGGILGMVSLNSNLANMSNQGKRMNITPISKGKMILGSVLASYLTQLIGLVLLFLFLYFVLKVDFGPHLGHIILLALVGSLAGLSLGIFVSSILKTNENTKSGIILAVTMAGCFFSGMMGITMKYIVDKNIPLLNKVNPANMITDGFYSLYYYDTFNRYIVDIVSLLLFSAILLMISYMVLRRQKYDNI